MTKADFERQKNFVKDLAGNFEFGPNAAQFGVITYSTGAQLDITLSQYKTSASFAQRVNSIKHAGIVFFFSFLFACLKQTKKHYTFSCFCFLRASATFLWPRGTSSAIKIISKAYSSMRISLFPYAKLMKWHNRHFSWLFRMRGANTL